jgi:hypothetical protein
MLLFHKISFCFPISYFMRKWGERGTVIEVPPVPIAVAGDVGTFLSALLTSATTPAALEHLLEELAELGCYQERQEENEDE